MTHFNSSLTRHFGNSLGQGSFFQPLTPPEISEAFEQPSQKDLQAAFSMEKSERKRT